MGALTALLNPWVLLGLLVAFIATGAGGYRIGEKVADDSYAEAKVTAEQKAASDKAEVENTQNQIATNTRVNYQKMLRQHEVDLQAMADLFRSLKEEVPKYVTPQADAGCVVTTGFVELYDRAFGRVPGNTVGGLTIDRPEFVDRPSGVPLSQVGAVSVDNAETCHRWEDQARSCRAYVTEIVQPFYTKLQESVHVCK